MSRRQQGGRLSRRSPGGDNPPETLPPFAAYYADSLAVGTVTTWPDAIGAFDLTQSTPASRPTRTTDTRTGQACVRFSASTSLVADVNAFDFLHETDVTVVIAFRQLDRRANVAYKLVATSTGETSKGYRLLANDGGGYNASIQVGISDGAVDLFQGGFPAPFVGSYSNYSPLMWSVACVTTGDSIAALFADGVESFAETQSFAYPSGTSDIPLTVGAARVEIAAIEFYNPSLTDDERDYVVARMARRVDVPQVQFLAKSEGSVINPPGTTRHYGFCHAAMMANGKVLATWRNGETHASDVGTVDGRIGTVDGNTVTWSDTVTILSGYGSTDLRDPCVASLSNGEVILSYFESDVVAITGVLRYIRSSDYGVTWSAPTTVTTSYDWWSASTGPWFQDGSRIYWPFYAINHADSPAKSSVGVLVSTDNGATWPTEYLIADGPTDNTDYQEPNVGYDENGDLLCIVRIGGVTTCQETISQDDGATWSALATSLRAWSATRFITLHEGTIVALARHGVLTETCIFRRTGAGTWSSELPDRPQAADAYFCLSVYGALVELNDENVLAVYSVQEQNPQADTRARVFPSFRLRSLDTTAVTLTPTTASVEMLATQAFTAVSGVSPFVRTLTTNASGGSIDTTEDFVRVKTYTAGDDQIWGTHDTVEVVDYLGESASSIVTVRGQWDPQDLASCTLWLDPTAGLVFDGDGGIISWDDQVAATHFTGSASLTYNINGRQTITANGTTNLFNSGIAASEFITATAWTIGLVWQDNGSPATSGTFYSDASIIGDCQTGLGGYWNAGVNSTGVLFGQYAASSVQDSFALSAGAHYMILWYDGTKVYYQLDGGSVSAGVAGSGPADITGLVRLFQTAFGARYAKGDLGDLFVCNTAPSSGDRTLINAFLAGRYGL